MKGDPKRWSERGGEATAFERALVEAARCTQPPPGASAAVWAGLVTRAGPTGSSPPHGGLPDGGLPGSHSAAKVGGEAAKAVGKAAATSLLTKIAVLAAITAVGAAGVWAVPRGGPTLAPDRSEWVPARAPQVSSIHASPYAAGVPHAVPEIEVPPAEALPSRKSRVPETPRSDPGAASAGATVESSDLRGESLALLAARNLLRKGDAAGALAKLDEVRAGFPNGGLAEEREALTIEALANAGQAARASELAIAFARAHPQSPFADQIRRFVAREMP